jgi:hypothetical protein
VQKLGEKVCGVLIREIYKSKNEMKDGNLCAYLVGTNGIKL